MLGLSDELVELEPELVGEQPELRRVGLALGVDDLVDGPAADARAAGELRLAELELLEGLAQARGEVHDRSLPGTGAQT